MADIRTGWMDLFGFDAQAAFKTAVTIADGVDVAKSGIPLTNHPDFAAGLNVIDQEKALGISQRQTGTGYEFQQGLYNPATTLEFDANANNLGYALWTMFQSGASEGAAALYTKTYIPYTDSDVDECWLTMVRKLTTTTSFRLTGMVCNSLTLSSEQGATVKASASFLGYDWEDDHDPSSDDFTFAGKAPLLWQNATCSLDTNTIDLPGFSITITNNLIVKHYDEQKPDKQILNRVGVEGTITLPHDSGNASEDANTQIDAFIAGTDKNLIIYWGAADAAVDGGFQIKANIRYTGAAVISEDELATELPFIGAYDGSNSAIEIMLSDSRALGIT